MCAAGAHNNAAATISVLLRRAGAGADEVLQAVFVYGPRVSHSPRVCDDLPREKVTDPVLAVVGCTARKHAHPPRPPFS